MRRIFVTPEAISGKQLHITGDLAHHLGKVLRLTPGTHVTVSCGDGKLHEAELQVFERDAIEGVILSTTEDVQETAVEVVLYQGMPKGDKLELVIQKCTELGVSRVVPVETSRAVVKLDDGKARKKQERWQKIAQEASEQSKRSTVPEVTTLMSWKEALQDMQEGLTIVLWEEEQQKHLREYLGGTDAKRINLIIGPEGGLSESEVETLLAQGAVSVSLGKRILRTETAAMTAVALVLYEFGELG